jgi:hypothetical protein
VDISRELDALIDDPAPALAPARAAFADELVLVPRSPRTQTLARPLVRALVRDEPRGDDPRGAGRVRLVTEYTGSSVLRADLPPLGGVIPPLLAERATPRRMLLSTGDVGATPVRDVLRLPNGRLAVALGEAGVRVLTRDGRTAALLEQPAERLVASDHGDRAIALARRGGQWRLAKLDLLELRGSYWCDARLDAWAPDYDGSLWFVTEGDALLAVDATADDFGALWRVSEHHARVAAVARGAHRLSALLELQQEAGEAAHPGFRRWSFELPGLTLRESVALRGAGGGALSPSGQVFAPEAVAAGDEAVAVPCVQRIAQGAASAATFVAGERGAGVARLAATDEWVAVQLVTREGCAVALLDVATMHERAHLVLQDSSACCARVQGGVLLVGDARGRVLGIELRHGGTAVDLRV